MQTASLISSAYGIQSLYETESVSRLRRKNNASTATRSSGDTVSISRRAYELSERLRNSLNKSEESGESSAGNAEGNEAGQAMQGLASTLGETSTASAKSEDAQGAGGSAGSGVSTADRIKQLQEEIRKVSGQLMTVMSGPGSPEDKMEKATPLQQHLNQLMQQMAALQAEAAKESSQQQEA